MSDKKGEYNAQISPESEICGFKWAGTHKNVSMTICNWKIYHQTHVLCCYTTFGTESNYVPNWYGPYGRCSVDKAVAYTMGGTPPPPARWAIQTSDAHLCPPRHRLQSNNSQNTKLPSPSLARTTVEFQNLRRQHLPAVEHNTCVRNHVLKKIVGKNMQLFKICFGWLRPR